MEPENALNPWDVPEDAKRELPAVRRQRRPWWAYAGTALVIALCIAGVALVAMVVMFAIGLSQWGNNK
jgi:hypothetical protein